MELITWKIEKLNDIDNIKAGKDVTKFIKSVTKLFLETSIHEFLSEEEIGARASVVRTKLKILQISTPAVEYFEFWYAFGNLIECWISELEGEEYFEAASNMKKLFDAC